MGRQVDLWRQLAFLPPVGVTSASACVRWGAMRNLAKVRRLRRGGCGAEGTDPGGGPGRQGAEWCLHGGCKP